MSRIRGLALLLSLAACGAMPEARDLQRIPLDAGNSDAGPDDTDAGPDLDAPDAGPDLDAGPDDDAGPQWDGDAGPPAFDVCNPCGPHVVHDVGIVDAGCNAGEVCMGRFADEQYQQYPDTMCLVATPNGICPAGYEPSGNWCEADSYKEFSVCMPPGGCP